MVGLNPEFAHETMSGLSFTHAVAQTLWHEKLFHIDLNAQRIGKFDQDFRFGSEGIRDAFYVVKLLEDAHWDGMRHFDAHPYRTEDADGRLGLCPGLHADLPDPGGQGPSIPGGPRDPRGARTARSRRLWPSRPRPVDGLDDILKGRVRRECAGRLGLRPRAPRPAGDGAAARGALVPLVVGVDSSTRPARFRCATPTPDTGRRPGRAPHTLTTPPRSEQHPHEWEVAFAAAPGQGRRCDTGRLQSRWRHSSTGWSLSTNTVTSCGPPSCGTTPSPHRDCTRASRRAPGGAASVGRGVRKRPRPGLHHHQAAMAAALRAGMVPARGSVLLPHDWLTFRLTGDG